MRSGLQCSLKRSLTCTWFDDRYANTEWSNLKRKFFTHTFERPFWAT